MTNLNLLPKSCPSKSRLGISKSIQSLPLKRNSINYTFFSPIKFTVINMLSPFFVDSSIQFILVLGALKD